MNESTLAIKRWLAEYEMETGFVLSSETNERWFELSEGVSVQWREAKSTASEDQSSIYLDLVFSAHNVDEAKKLGDEMQRDYVGAFCLASQCYTRTIGLRKLMDWTSGISQRNITVFRNIDELRVSLPIIRPTNVDAATTINKLYKDDRQRKAIQWFRRGVSARYSDEQFVYFYFAIEALATRHALKMQVVRCKHCKEELVCTCCRSPANESETSGRAVRRILEASLTDMANEERRQLVGRLMLTRNLLQHGQFPETIESKTGKPLVHQCDVLGRIAFNYIMHDLNKNQPLGSLQLLVPTTFANHSANIRIDGTVGNENSNPEEPKPSDFDGFRVSTFRSLRRRTEPKSGGQ